MRILAGTSGFAFKEWKGVFYPPEVKDAGFLRYYATRFPAVEINNTFYRMPKESVIADWAAQVPENFSFTIKASQRITHFQRLKPESAELVDYLIKATSVLGDRLGAILFQLPPNMKKDLERLHGFLDRLPANRRFAVEFRHESWFDDDVVRALREHDVAMVGIEQEDFSSPLHSTSSWGYVRLHRFDYSPEMLQAWANRLRENEWKEVFVFFKHDHVPDSEGSGPLAVEAFRRICAT